MSASINLRSPIFIVGPGRSGTTLLRSLLSAHSRISVTPETKFMSRADEWGLKYGSPVDFNAFWDNYTAWLRFRDLDVDADRCRELIDLLGEYSFSSIFRAVLFAYGEKTGKQRVGEKTPSHVRYLSYLLDWFPDAQILVAQRDPRAIIASQINTYYIKNKLTPRSIRHGLFTNKREQEIIYWVKEWFTDCEKKLKPWKNDPRFYTVVYEKLVQNPEQEIQAIFDFLGESFEPSVLNGRNESTVPIHAACYDDSLMEKWRTAHYSKTLQKITSDSLEKWKNELTKTEVALIEGIWGATMRELGYNPSLSPRLQFAGRTASTVIAASCTAETRIRKIAFSGKHRLRNVLNQAAAAGVARGMPPVWFSYRHIMHETVQEYFKRHGYAKNAGYYETIHPEQFAQNSLPCNVKVREELPDDRGWWGYSFRDVPQRISVETFMATLPDCLITSYRDSVKNNDFYPAILNKDRRAFDMREIRFRPLHTATLRRSTQPVKLKEAIWILERSYHNHSHWLTAHLPKLLLLREKNVLDQVILPSERTAAIDGSLSMLDMKPEQFQSYDPTRPLQVEKLTILGTDRFRPELLQMIPEAFGVARSEPPKKKVFISRLKATRRRLVNEEEIWSLLKPLGFQRVLLEEMTLTAQVELMRETAVLAAPHGAGLTNMLFCPQGAHIIEIADLSFPNPNFYAVASAMRHNYWLIPAESLGDVHPLAKDLRVDPTAIQDILPRLGSTSDA